MAEKEKTLLEQVQDIGAEENSRIIEQFHQNSDQFASPNEYFFIRFEHPSLYQGKSAEQIREMKKVITIMPGMTVTSENRPEPIQNPEFRQSNRSEIESVRFIRDPEASNRWIQEPIQPVQNPPSDNSESGPNISELSLEDNPKI